MHKRDIVVVGSSMGGIEALSSLASQMRPDFPAAIFVVQHSSPDSKGLLAAILAKRGPLPAATARDGMPVEPGRIYVAPPDRHMLVTPEGIKVTFGPRENRSRPAVDALFRTAAVNFRSRVIGVVLTGLLGDGAAGLGAVARCGGLALVQKPSDAEYDEMPRRALDVVENAEQFALENLGALLEQRCSEPAPEPPPVPEALALETRLTERSMITDEWGAVSGKPTSFTCPECHGAIHEIREEGLTRFRCRVGHAYSADDLISDKGRGVEESLWVALQTLQERTRMLEALAVDEHGRRRPLSAEGYERLARETHAHAERIRELLMSMPR